MKTVKPAVEVANLTLTTKRENNYRRQLTSAALPSRQKSSHFAIPETTHHPLNRDADYRYPETSPPVARKRQRCSALCVSLMDVGARINQDSNRAESLGATQHGVRESGPTEYISRVDIGSCTQQSDRGGC